MTNAQAAAYKIFGLSLFAGSFFLLRFAYQAVFTNAHYDMTAQFAVLPAGILGLLFLVAGGFLLIRGLGKSRT